MCVCVCVYRMHKKKLLPFDFSYLYGHSFNAAPLPPSSKTTKQQVILNDKVVLAKFVSLDEKRQIVKKTEGEIVQQIKNGGTPTEEQEKICAEQFLVYESECLALIKEMQERFRSTFPLCAMIMFDFKSIPVIKDPQLNEILTHIGESESQKRLGMDVVTNTVIRMGVNIALEFQALRGDIATLKDEVKTLTDKLTLMEGALTVREVVSRLERYIVRQDMPTYIELEDDDGDLHTEDCYMHINGTFKNVIPQYRVYKKLSSNGSGDWYDKELEQFDMNLRKCFPSDFSGTPQEIKEKLRKLLNWLLSFSILKKDGNTQAHDIDQSKIDFATEHMFVETPLVDEAGYKYEPQKLNQVKEDNKKRREHKQKFAEAVALLRDLNIPI